MKTRTIALNVGAFAAYVAVLFLLFRVARFLPGDWMRFAAAEVLSAVAGLILAVRFRAFVGAWVITAFLGYSLSMFIAHAAFGIRAAQGFAVHMAVLVASSIAVIAMAIVSRVSTSVRVTP